MGRRRWPGASIPASVPASLEAESLRVIRTPSPGDPRHFAAAAMAQPRAAARLRLMLGHLGRPKAGTGIGTVVSFGSLWARAGRRAGVS